MTKHSCLFCSIEPDQVIAENDLAFAIRDKFPVTRLHTLIIPKRHVESYFDLQPSELVSVHQLADQCRHAIAKTDDAVGGFNIGANVGETAGQKIFHVHVHLIPRRRGDVEPPPARP